MCSGPQAVLLFIRLNWLFQSRGLIYFFFFGGGAVLQVQLQTPQLMFLQACGLKVVKQQPVQNENGSLRAPCKDAFNSK